MPLFCSLIVTDAESFTHYPIGGKLTRDVELGAVLGDEDLLFVSSEIK